MQTGYKVLDLMTNRPVVATKELTVKDTAHLMENTNVNSIIVVEKEKAIGMVTDEDIVRKLVAKGLDPKKMRLKDIMSTELITIDPDKDVYDALLLMRDNGIRQLPVIENGTLAGVLTFKDILKIQPDFIDLLVEKYEIKAGAQQDDDEPKHPKKKASKSKDFFPELRKKAKGGLKLKIF